MFNVNDRVCVLGTYEGIVAEVMTSAQGQSVYVVQLNHNGDKSIYIENQVIASVKVFVTVDGVEIEVPKPLIADDFNVGDQYWVVRDDNQTPVMKVWDNSVFDLRMVNSVVGVHRTQEQAIDCFNAMKLIRQGGS